MSRLTDLLEARGGNYKTDIVDTIEALPRVAGKVYYHLLTNGWFDFSGHPDQASASIDDISDELGVSPQGVATAVRRLERDDLVVRRGRNVESAITRRHAEFDDLIRYTDHVVSGGF